MNCSSKILPVFVMAALFGCAKAEAPPPQWVADSPVTPQGRDAAAAEPTEPTVTAVPKATGEPSVTAASFERSQLADASAPFVLTLTTPPPPTSPTTVEVVAKLEVPRRIDAPATITVTLPAGATLVAGLASETLADLSPGVITRTFQVRLSRELTAADPVRIQVLMRDPRGSFGAKAERLYPLPKPKVPAVQTRMRPPVPRPVGTRPPPGKRRLPGVDQRPHHSAQ